MKKDRVGKQVAYYTGPDSTRNETNLAARLGFARETFYAADKGR